MVIRKNSKVEITNEKFREWISRTLLTSVSRFRARKKRGNAWKREEIKKKKEIKKEGKKRYSSIIIKLEPFRRI